MTEKDFSTIKKTLHLIQKVQNTTTANSMWVHFTHYDDGVTSINVTIFKHEGDVSVPFNFYGFSNPAERLRIYNKMVDFLKGK